MINVMTINGDDSHQLLKQVEVDSLTGLYSGRAFLRKTQERLEQDGEREFCLVAMDIENFRSFNKLYGRENGDFILRDIGTCLKEEANLKAGVAGYLGGDNFGILLPSENGMAKRLRENIVHIIRKVDQTAVFMPVLGFCRTVGAEVNAAALYDRATLARSNAKKQHISTCEYSSEMGTKIEEEIWMLTEVQKALEAEDFIFYIQPQYDISREKIVGGEALVRWRHRERGFISPGDFIPVLEDYGLIAKLDRYIWRRVSRWLREMLDKGYHPVPISINVSRQDIICMDVAEYLQSLQREYRLPANLLKVEITESAYTEGQDLIMRAVKSLRDAKFLVMMDDFGSGYSSLNMLKNIAIDVLKIDMRFLDIKKEEEKKGLGILGSVIQMARQLRVPVVVEGVETELQENYLVEMGCRYAQGYYYYKPMQTSEFEKLIADSRNLDLDGMQCSQVEPLSVREFVSFDLFNDEMINNILGAVAFFDMSGNTIEIIRVNEQYYKLLGISIQKEEYKNKFWNNVRDDHRQIFYSVFEQAYEHPEEGASEYMYFVRTDGVSVRVYLKLYFLRENEGHRVFYGALTEVPAEQESRAVICQSGEIAKEQLDEIDRYYGRLRFGYGLVRLIMDENGVPCDYEFVYANAELEKFGGYNMERLRAITNRMFANDEKGILEKAYEAACLGKLTQYQVYSPESCRYLNLIMNQYQYGYFTCRLEDMTDTYIYENALNHALRAFREVYFIQLEEDYCRMIYPDSDNLLERGSYQEIVNRHFASGKILPYDEEAIRKFLSLRNFKDVLSVQDAAEYKYRRSVEGVGEEWCETMIRVCEREDGVPKTAVLTIRSIEALMREKEEAKRHNMAAMLASMSDGFFVYEDNPGEKILYVNPTVLRIFGCDTIEEFRELTGNTFTGMVYEEDRKRIDWEIHQQVKYSEGKMDFILYRYTRKDGQVRWLDDCGHLVPVDKGSDLFYVFISDITDQMAESQKEKLIRKSQKHNEKQI